VQLDVGKRGANAPIDGHSRLERLIEHTQHPQDSGERGGALTWREVRRGPRQSENGVA